MEQMSLLGLVLLNVFMSVLEDEAVDLQVTPADRECQHFGGLYQSLERQSDTSSTNSEKQTSVIYHRYQLHEYKMGEGYQLHEYKMGNTYVGCRTGKKPEDYTAPKLNKSELHHMAD